MQYNNALEVASNIYAHLYPHCSIINIAGSVRREKEECKDVEIICIPKTHFTDMFNTETKRTVAYIEAVQNIGRIIKGDIHNGKYVQIEYTNARLSKAIMLDLFTPSPEDYYRQFAIRTGSAEYAHIIIAKAWLQKGWCGTSKGLRLQSECEQQKDKTWKCVTATPTLPPAWSSEQEFFAWLGIECRAPRYREINNSFNKELLR